MILKTRFLGLALTAALGLSLALPAAADCGAAHSTSMTTTTIRSNLTEADVADARLDLHGGLSLYGTIVDLMEDENGNDAIAHFVTFGDQHHLFVPTSLISSGSWLRAGDVARIDLPASSLDIAGLRGDDLQLAIEDVYGRDVALVLPLAVLDDQVLEDTMVGVRDTSGTIRVVTLHQALIERDRDSVVVLVPDIDVAWDIDADVELR